MPHTRFLGKIDGLFISLTAAILCHSLRCRPSGIFEDKVAFTRSNAGSKIKTMYMRCSTVSGSLQAKAFGNC